MEHFHAVPTYIKKEYKHLLEHPVPSGKSSSKVEIHHGGKHDSGYALVDTHNNIQKEATFEEDGTKLEETYQHQEHSPSGGYSVTDSNEDFSQQKGYANALQVQAEALVQHGGASGLSHGGGLYHIYQSPKQQNSHGFVPILTNGNLQYQNANYEGHGYS